MVAAVFAFAGVRQTHHDAGEHADARQRDDAADHDERFARADGLRDEEDRESEDDGPEGGREGDSSPIHACCYHTEVKEGTCECGGGKKDAVEALSYGWGSAVGLNGVREYGTK